jgi:hypothetical protein
MLWPDLLRSSGVTIGPQIDAGLQLTRTTLPKHFFNRGTCSLLRLWKRPNAPSFVTPMVGNQAMTAQCLPFAGHRKEFE